MVLDHIHYFFEFTGWVPTWFNMLGRLSAPLFLFCTVEGFAHTHDRKRYVLRIWAIGTAMAALEFFMIYADAFRRGDGFYPQNAIFQDLVLLCVVWQGIDWLREKNSQRALAPLPPFCAGPIWSWPFCWFPPSAGYAHCLCGGGVPDDESAAHVDGYHRR